MCTSSNKYTYEGRNLDLRLIKAEVDDLIRELFTIWDELSSTMYPVSAARAKELNHREELIVNELKRRIYE